MKKRILFVDDEQNVLDGIERLFRPFRGEWEMRFCTSGAQVLELMREWQAEVVVADMRMPGMDGAQLFAEVMRLYPGTIRIILSGHASEELTARSIGVTHQFLSKPCDPEALRSTVRKAAGLREILQNEALKRAVAQMGGLPSLPAHYHHMVQELQSPEPSVNRVAQIISSDPGMTAKVLQIVNSAFFGIRRQVSNTVQAVSYLGLDRIQQLCLSLHAFSQFEAEGSPHFSLDSLWNHSTSTAVLAKKIALHEGADKRVADESFTAGLLHDIGKLMLVSRMPTRYQATCELAAREGVPEWEAEEALLTANHAHVGAYLLGLWGLPDSIVEAVAFHHGPSGSAVDAPCPLLFVHAADVLDHLQSPAGGMRDYDAAFLERTGCAARAGSWATEIVKTGE